MATATIDLSHIRQAAVPLVAMAAGAEVAQAVIKGGNSRRILLISSVAQRRVSSSYGPRGQVVHSWED
jgi:hypothetical protein